MKLPQSTAGSRPGMTQNRLFAVIPAAGESRRMGRAKLLLPWGADTVIGSLLAVLRPPEIFAAVVIVRPDDAALAAAVRQGGADVCLPATPPADMRRSVELGLEYIRQRWQPASNEGWLLIPADHPLLEAAPLRELVARWNHGSERILAPTHAGRRGHPTFFRWSLAAEVAALPEGAGLNQLVRAHAAEVGECPVASPAVLLDLDTPEDYQRLLAAQAPPCS